MNKIALVLLTLPLGACAPNPPIPDQLAQAKAYCNTWGVGPNDSRYFSCLDSFTREHYKMRLYRRRDGSLTLLSYPFDVLSDAPM